MKLMKGPRQDTDKCSFECFYFFLTDGWVRGEQQHLESRQDVNQNMENKKRTKVVCLRKFFFKYDEL